MFKNIIQGTEMISYLNFVNIFPMKLNKEKELVDQQELVV